MQIYENEFNYLRGQKTVDKNFANYETNCNSVIWESDGDERLNLLAEHQTKPVGKEFLFD